MNPLSDSTAIRTLTHPTKYKHQQEPNRRRKLFSFYVVMDEVGRFFARFDPFGHKKPHPHPEPPASEPCDDHDVKGHAKSFPSVHIPVPLWIIKPASTHVPPPPPPPPAMGLATPLRANDTLMVNSMAMAGNITAAIPTVDEARLQGRSRRRRLLRGGDDGNDNDDPEPMAGEGGHHHGATGLGQRLARTEEVETLLHEQLWALPGEKQKAVKPKVLGEAYERITSQSVVFLDADADADADGAEAADGKAMGDSDGEATAAAAAAAEGHAIDHERRRQLLLHHWHGHGHGGRAGDFDDDFDDDYDEDEDGARPAYYSKDGGDWYWQTHGFRHLQEAGEGMDVEGDGDGSGGGGSGALMIDVDSPESSVPSQRRPSPMEVLNMTPEQQAALRERDREALDNLLRKASREEEAHRPEPHVSKSLDSVLAALAVRPPADKTANSDDDVTGGDNIPRRALQGAAAGANGQRAAALVSAVAGSVSEQQKAEIRQAVYDAAVSLVREAAREAMQEAGYGKGSGSGNSNNKARAGAVGRGGDFGNGGNEDAYKAAANAILNVMARNNNNQPAVRAVVIEDVEERAGEAAATAASRTKETRGRAIDTGRGKSLLEAARAAARQSASAGRPPAGYDPYPPHRHQRQRRLRGLKDATFRVPVPFTRDPSFNASSPKFVYNASDAVFINLSAREDEDGALQVTAQSMQGDSSGGDARQVPWPRIGGIGPALDGLGSSSSNNVNGDADPKGKGHSNKHAWADALHELVRKHQAGKHPGSSPAAEPHASRLLEEAVPPQPQPQQAQAPAKAPEAAAPAPEPAKQPTTIGDFLHNANTKKEGDADEGSAVGRAGGGGGGGGLDLNALAGILQRPFVPPVPGAMGTKPGETQQQPGTTDAFGNTIDPPLPAQQGQGQGQAPTSMMGEQEQEAYDEAEAEEEGDATEHMGLGDAFYDRAASQLLSHSGSNFKKMQAVVQGIMADEGFDV